MPDTYNGYTNFETWVVNLHLDNTQATQEEWQAEARACLETAREDLESVSMAFDEERVRRDAVYILADLMKDAIGVEECPQLPGLYGDLLRAALSEVNWQEIARNYITNLETA
jgi:hypothetical protein